MDDYLALSSEIRELGNLLASLPQDNVIERASLESRLKSAKQALAKIGGERLVPLSLLVDCAAVINFARETPAFRHGDIRHVLDLLRISIIITPC